MSRLTRLIRSVCVPLADARDYHVQPLQQPGFPVAVCWSAKSGCTTVLKWFLAHNGLLDEAITYSGWVHDYREQKLFPSTGYHWQCEQLFKHGRNNTTIIKVIRDPATRAVSSFLHYLRWSHDVAHWPVAVAVNQWKAAVGLKNQQGINFRQFLLFVATKQMQGALIDAHFRPQYDAKQDPRVDSYIRLENLAAGLRAVEDRHGLPHVDVRQLSTSGHHNPASSVHAWPTNAAEFAADHHSLDELGTPPAQAFLDADTLALIRTAYSTDYKAYGHLYELAPATLPMQPADDRAHAVNHHGLQLRAA